MSTLPPSRPNSDPDGAPLNPALKQVRDRNYGPDQRGTDPMETVSVKKDEGSYWPAVWATATLICIIVAIMLIVF
jgi:hypothetical protein